MIVENAGVQARELASVILFLFFFFWWGRVGRQVSKTFGHLDYLQMVEIFLPNW